MNVKFSTIACIILASGVGRRFGANKLLTAIDGAPMLQHILDISQGLFAKRIVVTRHKEVAEICAQQQISCLLHDKPYLSDTVRLGTAYIKQHLPQAEGLLFAVADQPLLQQASLIRLAESFLAQPQKIHRLYYKETPGNPIIFPAKFADELQQLPQDKGGSVLTKKYPELVVKVPVQDINELLDIDTQQDKTKLERLRPYSE